MNNLLLAIKKISSFGQGIPEIFKFSFGYVIFSLFVVKTNVPTFFSHIFSETQSRKVEKNNVSIQFEEEHVNTLATVRTGQSNL
jgi:hypothetical protein